MNEPPEKFSFKITPQLLYQSNPANGSIYPLVLRHGFSRKAPYQASLAELAKSGAAKSLIFGYR